MALNMGIWNSFKIKLLQHGYTFDEHETLVGNGIQINEIHNPQGELIEGDFILSDYSYGSQHGMLEAGFGFGISQHTYDDVLGYLTDDEALDLVMGTYWKKQGIALIEEEDEEE